MPHVLSIARIAGLLLVAAAPIGLSGCGLVALPLRTAGAVVKVVPVVGHIAAAPLDATADVID